MQLPRLGLVSFTWGNVSAVDRERALVVIKPSGVSYESMKAADMVVVDFDGRVVEGTLRPSSDTPTHLILYQAFADIGAVVHTHSKWATSWAQAGRSIPCYGTTHADYFYGEIPCVRALTEQEVEQAYERNTGCVIAEHFRGRDPMAMPAVLCRNHGPFTWGRDPMAAVEAAAVLESVAEMAAQCERLTTSVAPAGQYLQDKHYFRKHGAKAYYGQQ